MTKEVARIVLMKEVAARVRGVAVAEAGSADHGEILHCNLGDHLRGRCDRACREDRAGLAGAARGHRGCDVRLMDRSCRERRACSMGRFVVAAMKEVAVRVR